MTRRTLLAAVLCAVAVAATACGANPATPGGQTGGSAPAPTAAPAARTTVQPDAAPTTAALPTDTPVASNAPAPTTASKNSPYAGIEQGRTPEGYHVLGSANAPVTLVMYSDFF